jgi:hypothetical protein
MQTWAKRGFQTALVTGGLLMLGTGIASADEGTSPDTPAGPLDLNVNVPIHIKDNAIGTPLGQLNLPGYQGEVSTKPVTAPLKKALAPLTKAAEPATRAASPLTGAVGGAVNTTAKVAGKAGDVAQGKADASSIGEVTKPSLSGPGDVFKGNKVSGDLTAPIQITGNALGVIGNASVDSSDTQSYEHNQDVKTSGDDNGLAGNAVVLDWALPIQLSGNAGGLAGGSGKTKGSASQSATETGSISTGGSDSGASGNVVAGQFATPVQVTGNAASWILADAKSQFDADTSADSGGFIKTTGNGSGASGNVVGAPIALPVKFNGNAASAWGTDADAVSNTSADAKAGGKSTGINNIPSYIQTGGDRSFLSGNVAQPEGSLVANVDSVAASWIGNATTGNALGTAYQGTASSSSSNVESGGFTSTTAKNAAGSGNIADLPVALPVEACGVGGTYIGNAHAACDNAIDAVAGDGTYTNGDGSFLSSNTAAGQPAGTAEVFGIGGSHIGNASGTATEQKNIKAGGYNGTTGNNAAGTGNLVQVPLAVPAEVFGIGGSYIGQGQASATETKVVQAGGGGNTQDDNGLLTSNLVAAPLSVPAQVFGIGGSHIGRGVGKASADTTSTAGGKVHAVGDKAGAAGNIGFLPVSLPLQVHGLGGSFIGTGSGTADNLTDSKAGGDASTSGTAGAVAGNVIQGPIGGAGSVANSAAGLIALVDGQGSNDVKTAAGGNTSTNGDGGGLAGDVVSAQALPVVQVVGDAAAALAKATGVGTNVTEATSGGDITTSGVKGAFSGDILDVPAAAVAQVFGDAVAGLGVADAAGDNTFTGKVGGTDTTAGELKHVSGFNGQLPLGALVQIYNVPFELLGAATATATNDSALDVAGHEPQINLPINGSQLPATGLPSLPQPSLPSLPSLPSPAGFGQRADVPQINTLPVELSALELPKISNFEMPALPAAQLPDLPAMASLDSNPLDFAQKVTGQLNGKNLHIL